MRKVYVLGVGMSRFGKHPDKWLEELARDACEAAIMDSGLERRRIQAAFCGHAFGGRVAGQRALSEVGISGIPTVNVENACTSGATALHLAWEFVQLGRFDVALALGMDQMVGGLIEATRSDYEGILGRTLPGKYAVRANRYINAYDLTTDDLAEIAVKNRALGALNPFAHFREAVTKEQVLSSRMIAEPLTLLQCCPTSDGAAAILVGCREVALQTRKPLIEIRASALGSGKYCSPRDGDLSGDDELVRRTAAEAYRQASCGPEDIGVAEVHDAFTIGEVLAYDNLGFCERGGAARLIRNRVTWPHGRLPVNTSGGLLSRGHPLGATGIAQIMEIVQQLREEAGARQVTPVPKVGLTQCTGGAIPVVGTASCCVHILGR